MSAFGKISSSLSRTSLLYSSVGKCYSVIKCLSAVACHTFLPTLLASSNCCPLVPQLLSQYHRLVMIVALSHTTFE